MDSSTTDRAKLAANAASEEVHDILDAISQISMESINGLKTAIETRSLWRAAELLHRSALICVSGIDDSYAIAALLATGLSERGCECSVLGPGIAARRHKITGQGQNGLLIVIELPDGSLPGTLIELSRSHAVPILAIGESADERLADYCDLRLPVPKSKIVHGMPIMAGYIATAQLLLIALDQYRAAED